MIDRKSSLFLMANLGPEVMRALSLREKNDQKNLSDSVMRCQKMVDEVIQLPEMSTRKDELVILRAVIDDMMKPTSQGIYKISSESLQTFFNPFAIRMMHVLSA